jgi:hypothetical protein
MSRRSEIVEGIAEILWADGWMMHVEEHGCERIAGQNIMDIMPPIPKDARDFAEKWAKDVEKDNGKKLETIYEEAREANEREGKSTHSPVTFGNYLAYMMQGAGVSWFDDNAEFDLEVPRHEGGSETSDLMYFAGSKCKAAWDNPPCAECGAFNRSGERKCSNCGESLEESEDD